MYLLKGQIKQVYHWFVSRISAFKEEKTILLLVLSFLKPGWIVVNSMAKCMDECINASMDGWMNASMDGWMNECINGWMDGWMQWMDGCNGWMIDGWWMDGWMMDDRMHFKNKDSHPCTTCKTEIYLQPIWFIFGLSENRFRNSHVMDGMNNGTKNKTKTDKHNKMGLCQVHHSTAVAVDWWCDDGCSMNKSADDWMN